MSQARGCGGTPRPAACGATARPAALSPSQRQREQHAPRRYAARRRGHFHRQRAACASTYPPAGCGRWAGVAARPPVRVWRGGASVCGEGADQLHRRRMGGWCGGVPPPRRSPRRCCRPRQARHGGVAVPVAATSLRLSRCRAHLPLSLSLTPSPQPVAADLLPPPPTFGCPPSLGKCAPRMNPNFMPMYVQGPCPK